MCPKINLKSSESQTGTDFLKNGMWARRDYNPRILKHQK